MFRTNVEWLEIMQKCEREKTEGFICRGEKMYYRKFVGELGNNNNTFTLFT